MFRLFGLEPGQLFVLLFLGLGPIRICLSWLSVAHDLSHQEQRRVAWRITWVSIVLVAGIMLLGFFSIKNVAPRREWVVIGACIVLIISSLRRSPEPEKTDEPAFQRAMRMAIYPLAVPTMINPAGLGLLIIVAAYVSNAMTYIAFFTTVLVIFFINFGLMVLLGYFKREVPAALINIFGEVFAILLISLGTYYVFRALASLGLINLNL